MRVKRYLVDSMPDALEKIRVDLGKDAVILNTKPVKSGGFLGFFSKRQIEVIAAVDNKQPDEKPAKPRETPLASVQSFAAKQAYQRSGTAINGDVKETKTAGRTEVSPPTTVRTIQESQPVGEAMHTVASVGRGEQAIISDPAPNGEILKELRDMREAFQKLLLKPGSNENLSPAFGTVRDRLLKQEVESDHVINILQELAKRMEGVNEASVSDAMILAREVIAKQLEPVTQTVAPIGYSTKFAFFFGPTGVGKTTTIAKLAAESILKDRRKVGFITTDTFRIGAVEQLKTYANILNVPLEVVFSSKDLPQAMERLMHCDLIFVDTAGRNYRNDEYVHGIAEYLEQGKSSENYLVLSLTSRYVDMKAIVDHLKEIPIHKVIFTKADETQVYGSILNLAHDFGISLSYITVGQNVPDDIIVASSEVVSKLIVGEESYA